MLVIKYTIIFVTIIFSLTEECSGVEKSILTDKIYQTAKQELCNMNFKQAITQLEKLNIRYSYILGSNDASFIQLDLIYAYYKSCDLLSAKKLINRFIRLNPYHHNIDYVIYIHGLIDMKMDDYPLHKIFSVDRSNRDQKYARDAFRNFYILVNNYPRSKYIVDAIKRMIFLKNRLANHEYAIASYYFRIGAWVAVVNRVKDILQNYQDTQAARNGLHLMEYAYRQMKMFEQANKVAKIITVNKKISN